MKDCTMTWEVTLKLVLVLAFGMWRGRESQAAFPCTPMLSTSLLSFPPILTWGKKKACKVCSCNPQPLCSSPGQSSPLSTFRLPYRPMQVPWTLFRLVESSWGVCSQRNRKQPQAVWEENKRFVTKN